MSNMFTNYNNISPSYVPNNMHIINTDIQSYTKLNPIDISKPYELYNAKNELEGYFWYHGESIVLDFAIDGEITVETDALVFNSKGEYPSETTKGYVGQVAYNTADYKAWKCSTIVDKRYIWTQEGEIGYNSALSRSIYIDASDYLRDKNIELKIFDFRYNQIYSKIIAGTEKALFEIDKELSTKMIPGIYYCSLEVYNDRVNQKIFGTDNCKLLVK